MDKLKNLYDKRYSIGYREELTSYEIARIIAVEHFIKKVLRLKNKRAILDYGCGNGLYVGLWRRIFPHADLFFSDISDIALKKLIKKYPEFSDNCGLIKNSKTPFNSECFEVVISIEVMEHVLNLNNYLNDIYRLLKKGGIFIWTTPCANKFSIEQIYTFFSKNTEKTKEGYKRWKCEDQSHLRRLTTKEIKKKMFKIGFNMVGFRFRAHFFSFICSKIFKGFLRKFGEKIMLLDYILFKRFPNGASMIGSAYKLD